MNRGMMPIRPSQRQGESSHSGKLNSTRPMATRMMRSTLPMLIVMTISPGLRVGIARLGRGGMKLDIKAHRADGGHFMRHGRLDDAGFVGREQVSLGHGCENAVFQQALGDVDHAPDAGFGGVFLEQALGYRGFGELGRAAVGAHICGQAFQHGGTPSYAVQSKPRPSPASSWVTPSRM